ncbi:MAG TPA: RNA polymerase sigma factor [Ktedonobacterales bacterium]|nr:RNA polymerase sigma factor [Ktedonobacterales bacterium]
MVVIQAADAETDAFGAALSGERPRLVRLCARLTGNPRVAEDLAQETLFEAWRSRERLRAVAEIAPWLTAIARNVCLRWQRAQGREQRMYIAQSADGGEAPDPLEYALAPSGDLTLRLEQHELADLLGRAMALLPAETREALVASYLDELPQQELAARLGLGEGALRARLHRGRQMLRRVLEDDLRADALSWGLLATDEPQWQETRIWCPFCGVHHLSCRLDRATGVFSFRCAGACQPGIRYVVGSGEQSPMSASLTSPKALLSRHCVELGNTYRSMIAGTPPNCSECGAPGHVTLWQPDHDMPAPILAHGIAVICPRCGHIDGASPWHLALDTVQAIRFWRRHPRMRALPVRTLDFAGRPAVWTGFESGSDHARLDIITARDTLDVLHTSESA